MSIPSFSSPIEEVEAALGVCRMCGGPVNYRLTEPLAEQTLEMWEDRPVTRRMATIWNWLCDPCGSKSAKQRQRAHRQAIQDALVVDTYARWMPEEARAHTFAQSAESHEDQNRIQWNWAMKWEPSQGNAWIWGGEGTGKTWMLHAILNAMLDNGLRVACVSAIEFHIMLQDYPEHALRHVRPYFDHSVLGIDDLDKAGWNDRSLQGLWLVLDKRYNLGLRTLVTTNLSAHDVTRRMKSSNATVAPTLLARLRTCPKPTIITMGGKSLRQRTEPPVEHNPKPEDTEDDEGNNEDELLF